MLIRELGRNIYELVTERALNLLPNFMYVKSAANEPHAETGLRFHIDFFSSSTHTKYDYEYFPSRLNTRLRLSVGGGVGWEEDTSIRVRSRC